MSIGINRYCIYVYQIGTASLDYFGMAYNFLNCFAKQYNFQLYVTNAVKTIPHTFMDLCTLQINRILSISTKSLRLIGFHTTNKVY